MNDTLFLCDGGNHRVQILNTELECVNSFGCHGDGDGQFNRPNDIAQDRAENLYVADAGNKSPSCVPFLSNLMSFPSLLSLKSEELP